MVGVTVVYWLVAVDGKRCVCTGDQMGRCGQVFTGAAGGGWAAENSRMVGGPGGTMWQVELPGPRGGHTTHPLNWAAPP